MSVNVDRQQIRILTSNVARRPCHLAALPSLPVRGTLDVIVQARQYPIPHTDIARRSRDLASLQALPSFPVTDQARRAGRLRLMLRHMYNAIKERLTCGLCSNYTRKVKQADKYTNMCPLQLWSTAEGIIVHLKEWPNTVH